MRLSRIFMAMWELALLQKFCTSGEMFRKIFVFLLYQTPFLHSVLLDTHLSLVMLQNVTNSVYIQDVNFISSFVLHKLQTFLYSLDINLFHFCIYVYICFALTFYFRRFLTENKASSLHLLSFISHQSWHLHQIFNFSNYSCWTIDIW